MELPPTIRAQLGALEAYLEDEAVTEVLVAAPERVFVTRNGRSEEVKLELSEPRIRSMADRLVRAVGPRGRRASSPVSGPIGSGLIATVIGSPRAERCPLIRVVRADAPIKEVESTSIGRDAAAYFARMAGERRSVVIFGPHGSGRSAMIARVVPAWASRGRVVVIEHEEPASPVAGHVHLDAEAGVPAALAAAADVIVASGDPSPEAWAQLVRSGRPFVASLEAPDAQAGLQRLIALCLAGAQELSRPAAEALVHASLGLVVELSAGSHATDAERAAIRLGGARFESGELCFSAIVQGSGLRTLSVADFGAGLDKRTPEGPSRSTSEALQSGAGLGRFPHEEAFEGRDSSDLSQIRAENLVSTSFVGLLNDPADAPDVSERAPTLVGRDASATFDVPPSSVGNMQPDEESLAEATPFDPEPSIGELDSTQAGKMNEMVSGRLAEVQKAPDPAEDEVWDDDGPSEVIDGRVPTTRRG